LTKKLLTMKKILIIALLFTACSQRDEQFCKCLEASEKLNLEANKLLSGKSSSLSKEERAKLKIDKEMACADYQTMTGEEMLKRKAECE